MVRIFGLGIGLFLMSILWPTVLILFTISRRAKPPLTTLGMLSLIVMTLLTIVLILIPRKSDIEEEEDKSERREADFMSLMRPIIIIMNIMALLFGLLIIYNKFICKQIIRPKISELNIRTVKLIDR